MKFISFFSLPALLVFSALLLTQLLDAQTPKERATLEAHAQAYLTARNAGDAKAIATLYAENGVRIGYDGSRAAGRAAIEVLYTATFKVVTFVGGNIVLEHYTMLPGNYVLVTGTYEGKTTMKADGTSQAYKGQYTNLLHLENGDWKIISLMLADLLQAK